MDRLDVGAGAAAMERHPQRVEDEVRSPRRLAVRQLSSATLAAPFRAWIPCRRKPLDAAAAGLLALA